VRRAPVACLVAMLVMAACEPAGQAPLTAIVGATLVDGSGGAPVEDSVILIAGAAIVAAGPRATVSLPARAVKVDGRGKYAVPASGERIAAGRPANLLLLRGNPLMGTSAPERTMRGGQWVN